MDVERFSCNSLEVNPSNYGANIIAAFEELRRLLGADNVKAYEWNADYIAAGFCVRVSKPSRGTVNDIDIRDEEPILLLIDKKLYPYKCPRVRLDRKDFPVKNVPHLNPVSRGQAPSVCFHRGNVDDWFTEHTLKDLIFRVKSWLKDAARNKLIPDGDLFEFTRVEGAAGVAIYDNAVLVDYINKYWDSNQGQSGYAFLWMQILAEEESYEKGSSKYAVCVDNAIHDSLVEKVRDISLRINEMREELKTNKIQLIGILVFPRKDDPNNQYLSIQPQTLEDILEIGHELRLPIQDALDEYYRRDLKILKGVPLVTTILRPRNIIGLNSNIEFLHFVLCAYDEHAIKEGVWHKETPAFLLQHRKPLTIRLAREISTSEPLADKKLMVVGCGAVGSKVIMHLARSGETNLILVDDDELSPHNMVRHALLPSGIGANKAKALKSTIDEMFKSDTSHISIDVIPDTIHSLNDREEFSKISECHSIIDCTASSNVLDYLVEENLSGLPPVIRCEIADQGKIGLCFSEGSHRNPRLDDLQAALFDLAIENDKVSDWLVNHRKQREKLVGPALQDINIGMSCSSSTMRLADDIISYHSAVFSMGIRKVVNQNSRDAGNIRFSYYDNVNDILGHVAEFEVGKVLVFKSGKGNDIWEVRVNPNAVEFMTDQLVRSVPSETGGILIGYLQPKRKIIYVTRALSAPSDSKSSPYAFVRGIADMPEVLVEIEGISGGLLGYVGEWHTHPFGGTRLSSKDLAAVRNIKATLDKVSMPTHIMVVTPKAIASYVF